MPCAINTVITVFFILEQEGGEDEEEEVENNSSNSSQHIGTALDVVLVRTMAIMTVPAELCTTNG